ncbi:hypothetical protein [Alicyclobacillus ferrooxydans]|uniref:Uncharacterized protein n=1 Tax=Alicyclobacillus ferrooxydans TaxID=471514 RepID=A0A0P9CAS2_9BACL|nr:hypothetical protein [Alicyclobacillus ferrooxydans]KPV42539.1 hypothetical protein AN477_17000 [Alicyclobacillus ferrooxydans]
MKTPEQTRVGQIALLSQSTGALSAGLPTLTNMGIPYQYSVNILDAEQSAIGALEGAYSATDQQKLAKWLVTESTLLRTYETQKNPPNIPLLKQIFKEINDAIPISTS